MRILISHSAGKNDAITSSPYERSFDAWVAWAIKFSGRMSTPHNKQLVWFIKREQGLSDAIRQSIPLPIPEVEYLTLPQVLSRLKRKLRPGLLIIEIPPGREAQKILNAVQELAPGLCVATLSIWNTALEMKRWLTAEIFTPPVSSAAHERANPYNLSSREVEVLRLMIKGLIKKEIAEGLFISYHTVDNHQRNIFRKLNVHTRSAAVAKAVMEKLC